MWAKGLVMERLAATADRKQMDVVSYESDHLGPVELVMDILDHLGDARVSSQVMVMMGVKDIQLDILIVRDIDQSLVERKSPSCESDQGSGEAMAGVVVVMSGPTGRHVR